MKQFFILFCLLGSMAVSGQTVPKAYRIEMEVEDILKRMTLQAKIGQLNQRGLSSRHKGKVPPELRRAVKEGKIGSFLNVIDPDLVNELQKIAIEESESKIPLLFGRDVIHGFRTIFPIPLGQAASWDPEMVEKGCRISAIEARSKGINWTFAPMIDIARDPRWGRIAESCGEDPYLTSVLGAAMVKGFQGNWGETSLAACAKHFAAYGAAEGGRDYNTAMVHEQELRNVYLKPFKAAKDAGVATYMTSFNELNGVPSSGNKFLLRQILREEWGFNGFVVSDWDSVIEMINHGFCVDEKDAARKAILAGLEMEMTSKAFETHMEELIKSGEVPMSVLDEAVKNILRVKVRLSLFDYPYVFKQDEDPLLAEEHLEAAKDAAIQSCVLLKNDKSVLPLKKEQKIALIGPLADAPHEQLGTWVFDGKKENTVTVNDALAEFHKGRNNLQFAKGLEISRTQDEKGFEAAIEAAKQSDVILFVGGEESILSGEAHSRANIDLPGYQERLIKKLAALGKPVVLVVMAGRPITMGNIIDDVDAVLFAWHPGTMGGPAIVDLLYGAANPSGKLPVTFPKTAGQAPIYYNHKNTGRPPKEKSFVQMYDIPVEAWQSSLGNQSHYLDAGYLPAYPFGFGMSYTTFRYSQLKLSSNIMDANGSITVSAIVKNTGSIDGAEIVQLYIRDLVGDLTRPVKELKGFKKVFIKAGESVVVTFELKGEQLAFYNQEMELVTEKGQFHVWVAPNSAEGLKGEFEVR